MINLNLEEGQTTIQIVSFTGLGKQYLSITYWFVKQVLSQEANDLKTEFGVNA